MRDEGRRSAVQVMNVGNCDFVLRHGDFIGEAEQVTAVEERAPKSPDGQEVVSEEAAASIGKPVSESDQEESCDDGHIQVVIDNLPPELNFEQKTAAKKVIRDRAGLFPSRITISKERTWFNM